VSTAARPYRALDFEVIAMPDRKAVIPALFVILWPTGFIGARYAMPWAEPFTFLAVRFALAGAVLAAIGLLASGPRLRPRAVLWSVLIGALLHGVYLGGVFWAVRQGLPAGLSALIAGLQPLLTTMLAGLFLGEAVLLRHWTGLVAGFAGVVAVLAPKLGTGLDAVTPGMLAAAFAALAGICVGSILQKRHGPGDNLVAGTAWQYAGAALLMAAGSAALETRTIVLTGELVLVLLWSVFVLSVGAIFLLMLMIREGAMAKVSALFYLVPAVTAAMAWALFGETLTPVQLGGMALASFGVALATSGRELPAAAAHASAVQPPTRARASR
jgi:drug/metabolite transporter (DMT)-like permease